MEWPIPLTLTGQRHPSIRFPLACQSDFLISSLIKGGEDPSAGLEGKYLDLSPFVYVCEICTWGNELVKKGNSDFCDAYFHGGRRPESIENQGFSAAPVSCMILVPGLMRWILHYLRVQYYLLVLEGDMGWWKITNRYYVWEVGRVVGWLRVLSQLLANITSS